MRTVVENVFGQMKDLCKILSMKRSLKLIGKGGPMARMVVFAHLMVNCKTCMNGNQATNIFGLLPPTIEKYLPLDEVLIPAPLTEAAFPL